MVRGMSRFIALALWLVNNSLGFTQFIVGGEYFIDQDPGLGSGTYISLNNPNDVEVNLTFTLTDLSKGNHRVSWRVKNNLGMWSHCETRLFYIFDIPLLVPTSDVIMGEWFVDEDPGLGNGVSINFPSNSNVEMSLPVFFDNLSEGSHTVSLRMKNEQGVWSHHETRLFYVYPVPVSSAEPLIVAAEWFIDIDPGIGNANPIAISPTLNADVALNLSILGVPVGEHLLFLRVKDAMGKWTHYEGRLITINNCIPVSELCNYMDDDCDGITDNGVSLSNFYLDNDQDGEGAGSTFLSCYSPGTQYVTNDVDCNDDNDDINTISAEICGNNIDENCDGILSPCLIEGCTNYAACNFNVNALQDNGSCILPIIYYADSDGDNYGNSAITSSACSPPTGYVTNSNDCNDNNAALNTITAET